MRFQERGVSFHDKDRATPGYTLFAPLRADKAYLINNEGETVHTWQLGRGGINRCGLTKDGNLFICEGHEEGPNIVAGKGGTLREYDWDSNVVWEYQDPNQHHDARRLDNGNSVYIAWELLDDKYANRVQGGIPGTEHKDNGGIYGDCLKEVNQAGEVVWEWHFHDEDIEEYPICPLCHRYEFAHANTVSPLANGDYLVSFRVLNQLVIIDRETRRIKWSYRDLGFGHQHDCHFLDNGNILVFANGFHGRDIDMYSRLIEFDPDSKETKWEYIPNPPTSMFSGNISGMQRLWSGNTLICEGGKGCLTEITPDGEVVWEYTSPVETPHPIYNTMNWIFRAYRYAPGAPELQGRF